MVLTAILWAAILACAALAVAGFARLARTDTWREPARWDGPLVLTSAALALLAFEGVLPAAAGAFLALMPLLIIAMTAARAWRALARAESKGTATRWVLSGIAANVLGSVRDTLAGLPGLRRGEPDGEGLPPAAPVPVRSTPPRPGPGPVRAVPPVRYDAVIGPAPAPEQVAQGLEGAGVPVPAVWAAVAEWTGSFEADTEEDLITHEAEETAGVLAYFEAVLAKAENLGSGNGLDHVYVAGHFEYADEVANLASFKALLAARYHALYDSLHDAAENGGRIPENTRQWLGLDGPAQGGQAA
jgi:hypothetical protein